MENDVTKLFYYFPREEYAAYESIVDANKGNLKEDIYEYLSGKNDSIFKEDLAQKYYTALGRERYGMYRLMND